MLTMMERAGRARIGLLFTTHQKHYFTSSCITDFAPSFPSFKMHQHEHSLNTESEKEISLLGLHSLVNYSPTHIKYSSIDHKFVIKADLDFALKADAHTLCAQCPPHSVIAALGIYQLWLNLTSLAYSAVQSIYRSFPTRDIIWLFLRLHNFTGRPPQALKPRFYWKKKNRVVFKSALFHLMAMIIPSVNASLPHPCALWRLILQKDKRPEGNYTAFHFHWSQSVV